MSEEQHESVEMWLRSEKESIISRVTQLESKNAQLEERIADVELIIIDLLKKLQP